MTRRYQNPTDTLLLCGVDEAGRGPLAGAVFAAAVVLDPRRPRINNLHDSKLLDAGTRLGVAGGGPDAGRPAPVAAAARARCSARRKARRSRPRSLSNSATQ